MIATEIETSKIYLVYFSYHLHFSGRTIFLRVGVVIVLSDILLSTC